jgi:hypothetical protein
MMETTVELVYRLARFVVRTRVVNCDATKRVHHVLRVVPGLASIRGFAACHVLHLVSAFHAICAVRKPFRAGTNALAFAAKLVLKVTVKHVGAKMTLE